MNGGKESRESIHTNGVHMFKKISSTTFWLLIFVMLVAVQAYSAFGQSSEIERKNNSELKSEPGAVVTGLFYLWA
mgnify:FL=1